MGVSQVGNGNFLDVVKNYTINIGRPLEIGSGNCYNAFG